jgi:hypothetical protein
MEKRRGKLGCRHEEVDGGPYFRVKEKGVAYSQVDNALESVY